MFHSVLCGLRNSYKPLRSPEKSPFIGSTREDGTHPQYLFPLNRVCVCVFVFVFVHSLGASNRCFIVHTLAPPLITNLKKNLVFRCYSLPPPLSKYQIRYCKPPINQRSWVRCWSRKVLLARKTKTMSSPSMRCQRERLTVTPT